METPTPDPPLGEPPKEPQANAESPPVRRCGCGYDRHHKMVSRRGKHGFAGWLFGTFMGVSMRPRLVKYFCRMCYQEFDETTDPAVLEATT